MDRSRIGAPGPAGERNGETASGTDAEKAGPGATPVGGADVAAEQEEAASPDPAPGAGKGPVPAAADGADAPPGPSAPGDGTRAGGAGGQDGGGDTAGEPVVPKPARSRRRRVRRVLLGLVLLLVLPPLAAATALCANYTGDPADSARTRGKDAIWLGHAWVDGRKKDADVSALAARLKGTGIRDLYVHAGPLEHDGTLPGSAYANAPWFIDAVHREMPGIRVHAWLGDVLASEGPRGMRLERARTRAAVVRSTREILAAGFEGAHFDLEPLHSGDRDYLTLLDALHRVTAAEDAPLSVAAHQIDPLPALHSVAGSLTGHPKWWSQEFFGQVARRVDQIAVMSYDTAMPLESMYGGYVAQQTSLALEVTPPTTDLLMGLPFFHESDIGHHESAETVSAAVRGVRLGLSRTDADRADFGVALYVDFAAKEADWAAYRKDWVR
ncbi:hypothetical protein ACIBBD_15415 [Streptomyces sp. NPDC051315]|uniref:hypothetical protein n=1 Tax=Streptomyces sp. NPDC051315 TaxID=3365650 RepID=UPI00378E4CD9